MVEKVCFKRSMYLFRESGVEIVVLLLFCSIDSICGNPKEGTVCVCVCVCYFVLLTRYWGNRGVCVCVLLCFVDPILGKSLWRPTSLFFNLKVFIKE